MTKVKIDQNDARFLVNEVAIPSRIADQLIHDSIISPQDVFLTEEEAFIIDECCVAQLMYNGFDENDNPTAVGLKIEDIKTKFGKILPY